jgi:hypothetical protein
MTAETRERSYTETNIDDSHENRPEHLCSFVTHFQSLNSVVYFVEYDDEQMNKDEIDRSRNTRGAHEKCIQILVGKSEGRTSLGELKGRWDTIL